LWWLDEDESDPGYHMMTERGIAEEVMACDKMVKESDDD
jgi:hypothetical protein